MWVDAEKVQEERKGLWSSKTLMDPSKNSTGLTLMLSTFEPSGDIPVHSHDEEEYIFVVSGEGKISIDGHESDLLPMRLFYLQKQAKHTVRNTGKEPLRLFRLYSPKTKG